MKVNQVVDAEWLKVTDLENMFDVRQDKNGFYMYNLNEALYVNVDESDMQEFTCDCVMHWPLISYKIYGTTRLTWLLMKINNVQPDDMFKAKRPSETVKYVPQDYVQTVVKSINDYGEY